MPTNMFFLPYRPAYDGAGISVPGAQAYFTAAGGTNTPLPTYSDAALTTLNTNPLVADGAGRFPTAYLTASDYRVRIYNRNAEVGVDTPLEEYDPYIPGALTGFVIGNESTVVGTRAALAALVGATNSAVYLAESGREGLFYWDSSNLSAKITADTNQGIYVPPASAPTGASGAWVRKYDGPVQGKWFGILADGSTNEGAKIASIITLLNTFVGANITGYGTAIPTLELPFTPNYINMGTTTLDLTNAVRIVGQSGGTFGGAGTVLKWSAGTIGIKIHAQNCYLDGITLLGSWLNDGSNAEGEYHAVKAYYKFIYGQLYLAAWQGDGLYANVSGGSGGDTEGNCNGIYGANLTVNGCRRGLYLSGADTNASHFGFIDANYNRQAGIYDNSAFGNRYDSVQTSGNGVQGVAGTIPVCVFNNGHVFTVKTGQATGASTNSPPSTATSNTWWVYWKDIGAATAYAPQWVSGTTYREGGSIHVPGANASQSTTIGYLYTETDQPPVQTGPSALIQGGLFSPAADTRYVRGSSALSGVQIGPKIDTPWLGATLANLGVTTAFSVAMLADQSGVLEVGRFSSGVTDAIIRPDSTAANLVLRSPDNNTRIYVNNTDVLFTERFGYVAAIGVGGAVTQATSKSTGVTLNKACGQVTMNNAALAAGAKVPFVVTNNQVAATDTFNVAVASGGTANAYRAAVTAVAAGSFTITVENITAGSLSEAPVINFAVVKAAAT